MDSATGPSSTSPAVPRYKARQPTAACASFVGQPSPAAGRVSSSRALASVYTRVQLPGISTCQGSRRRVEPSLLSVIARTRQVTKPSRSDQRTALEDLVICFVPSHVSYRHATPCQAAVSLAPTVYSFPGGAAVGCLDPLPRGGDYTLSCPAVNVHAHITVPISPPHPYSRFRPPCNSYYLMPIVPRPNTHAGSIRIVGSTSKHPSIG